MVMNMMKKVLVVVDMQNDFVTGPLGTKEAQAILPAIAEKIKNFDGTVIYTRDTHQKNYLETQEERDFRSYIVSKEPRAGSWQNRLRRFRSSRARGFLTSLCSEVLRLRQH